MFQCLWRHCCQFKPQQISIVFWRTLVLPTAPPWAQHLKFIKRNVVCCLLYFPLWPYPFNRTLYSLYPHPVAPQASVTILKGNANLPWVASKLSNPQSLTHEAVARGPIWLCVLGPAVLHGYTPQLLGDKLESLALTLFFLSPFWSICHLL